MNMAMKVMILAIIITVGIQIIFRLLSNKEFNHIVEMLDIGEYEELDKRLNSFYYKLIFQPFNLEYMKLNSYILQNDDNKVHEQFVNFTKYRLNEAQKSEVFAKVCSYFVTNGNKEYAKEALDKIDTLKDEKIKSSSHMVYDTYINKGSKYLDDALKAIEETDGANRAMMQLLIAQMYKNKGDMAKAKEFESLGKDTLKPKEYIKFQSMS